MDKPLVSVAIITYNSAQTVLETLDSVYFQSYPEIELIISDDCSSDNTLAICQLWISNHKARFTNCKIIQSATNTGVAANCNRAIAAISGDYLKSLAGDDLLERDAISEYISYVSDHPQAIFVFSRVEVFGDNPKAIDLFTNTIFDYSFFSLSRAEQYKWLISQWFQPIPAASVFINAKLAKVRNILFYDERIPMLEDWPKWIVLSEEAIDFHFIDKQLVKYRVTDSSICSGNKYKEIFNRSIAQLYRYYQFKPTIRLFGLRHALVLYLKNMAVIYPASPWSALNKLMDCMIRGRNLIINSLNHG